MEKTISLYEMATDLVNIAEVEEVTEEVRTEIMEAMKEAMENKAENIIAVIRNYESRIEAIKSEEKRLSEYRKGEEKKLERLKDYTLSCMEMMGNKKLETNIGRISLRKKPDTLIVLDENKVPDIYKTVKEVINIDKAQIKKDLKESDIEGVILQVGGNSLQIK
ncbi:siphovirus Gp157 family protein [[Clostridium] bifermentans ATCC 638]|uniref:Siphovirus Gp157 family protein n=1 Tax=Paraclostridium bifermentans ATCC 638 = DSM 14991 TaxID=1233171 RepID=T4VGI6_PARBF|nr:siphovirus Gp157 family protein [Paraclostridium bifermentans]EQK39792.1 siphovirus Gp157 family protein [[Clostridium] bifermentans ATCC 638] [Paraclostridium bifermentans ATCC 638 = DSM 14991]RIZ57417.1 hypothetical protein CHH45_16400 [Paraclostridium bifermentans]